MEEAAALCCEFDRQLGNSSSDSEDDGCGENPKRESKRLSSNRQLCDECGPSRSNCVVCGALPFHRTNHFSQGALWDEAAAFGGAEWDGGGLYDIILQMNNPDVGSLSPKLAAETAAATTRYLKQLKQRLINAGLQRHADQNYTGESMSSARIIAPFDIQDVTFGQLLGTGGFSSVWEVLAFDCKGACSRTLSPAESMSRTYLAEHAKVSTGSGSTSRSMARRTSVVPSFLTMEAPPKNGPYTRYAVKYLKNTLVEESPEKFKRAAVDLVLEGQLLLVLDHPHIVSVRGWSAGGASAYLQGHTRDFFLILDKLPETLEDRIWPWRKRYLKYHKRWKRRSSRRRSSMQVKSWVRRRLSREESPCEDQVDTEAVGESDKYAIKLLALLLERLQAARDVASAIAYMHSKRLMHRDLKSSNIGFDVHGEVKLFDLGLSRLLPKRKSDDSQADTFTDSYQMSRVGTKYYMCPEVRQKEPYGLAADVYSFGVVLWEFLTLSSPRSMYKQDKEQKERGSRDGCWLPICPCWSAELQTLVTTALSDDATERPSMEEAVLTLDSQIQSVRRSLQKMEQADGLSPRPRRRSTFRLDLSKTNLNAFGSGDDQREDCSADGTMTAAFSDPDTTEPGCVLPSALPV